MLNKERFKDIIIYVLLIGLFILTLLIIKPVISSIVYGILLAYIFHPLYKLIKTKLKNENISAFLVCLIVLTLIVGMIIILLSSLLNQVIDLYLKLQKTDVIYIIQQSLPSIISSSEASTTIVSAINTSISNILASYLGKISNLILDIPIILLQLFIVIFIFFFALKDGERLIGYLEELSPLKKENHNKFFTHLKDITSSVLIGQVLVGILQGIIAGIGYFIFGVPNTLLLTLLTIIIGIIPLIGPWLIWIPVDIYLFTTGRNVAGTGLLIYGLILINWVDVFIRPLIVSKKTKINTAVVIIGMIGGLFAFGILGLILGPLVLAYLLLVIEVYRKKTINPKDNLLFKEE